MNRTSLGRLLQTAGSLLGSRRTTRTGYGRTTTAARPARRGVGTAGLSGLLRRFLR